MPSLKALEDFKFFFRTLGNEEAIRAAQNLPVDDLSLPGAEPSAPPPSFSPTAAEEGEWPPEFSDDPAGPAGDDAADFDTGLGDDFDFSTFLDAIPDDLPPPEPELPDPALPGDDADVPGSDDAAPSLDDATLEPGDAALNPDDAAPSLDDVTLEPGDAALNPDDAAPSFDDVTLDPDDAALNPADAASAPDDAASSPATPDFSDAEGPDPAVEVPPDLFENFKIDQDSGAGAEEKDEGSGKFPDLDEFGIDDIFPSSSAPSGGADASGRPEAEEINLTDEEFDRLEKTLESYPLNLRIACEEIIAEQAVARNLLSALVKLLVRGGSAREAASQAEKILGRTIPIPRGFEKKTGEALEEEQGSFSYVFAHTFLPVLRIFFIAVLAAVSLFYLVYRFIYTPLRADRIYRLGYERIGAGEYERANERFNEAFRLHRSKDWFFRYAEAFRDARQYLHAEQRYDELLRFYPREKQGALDYAAMETNELRNYPKAERILRTHILDYAVDDRDGLLALGDNNMAWGELEPARYEDARQAYARLLERYGWKDPFVERMLLYFIRTDNLKEVLPLQQYFTEPSRGKIRPAALAELGGYLLDKRLEESRGVPDENIERIGGLRDLLIRAVQAAPGEPEPHYHLARYFNRFGNASEERQSLEAAVRAFDRAQEESPRRSAYRIDAERRYARILVKAREFFAAEEQLSKGVAVYQDALKRRLLSPSPSGGGLYADLGDIEYFAKSGNMEAALAYYRQAEQNLWAPPEMIYRMGSAYYHLGRWAQAQERFWAAASEMPLNRRMLHALGNISYIRGNYFAAQGYYNRLLDLLDAERSRFPLLVPHEREDHLELAERMMVARNNMGVAMEALSARTGNPVYRSGALGFYSESARAWDALTRDPGTMVRSGAGELSTPGINLAYLNSRNLLYPQEGYEPQLFRHIDKDVLEPSEWETLAPAVFRLSDQLGPAGAF
jgi:tetratricopeptide (TPR) repeat protein